MKKPTLFVIGILVLAFISIYFIIPQKIKTTNVIEIDAADVNIAKFLVNKRQWNKWWPGQHNTADSIHFSYNGADYVLQESTNSAMKTLIKIGDIELSSQLLYATTGEGMSEVTWVTEMQSSINPIKRIAEFVKIKHVTKDIDTLLTGFKKFMQTDTNVYGIAVKISKIKNPTVLASTIHTNDYPSPVVIYNIVNNLKKQVSAQNAIVADSPMLNVHANEGDGYQVMVAIPINKTITAGPNTIINQLVMGGNLLETTVKGGKNTILNAFTQLKHYQKDHRLISPAMPYELLITNRLAEKDTAKWVTKVFWPIF
ncbi:hypothetical protein [Mucilaginibacter aquariorum]|uniref:AraC family transcriptional regulator n=1 Tax=Mucilaginibacter aquariorum TaxID=2967225 RepID=A0ABT1T0G8_9SPHI|nr:hypothetical protein [Mucilaginibacter aquariorum]MCQ6958064.1 hypothetical protein [Mucilaginibacter aquariorum]